MVKKSKKKLSLWEILWTFLSVAKLLWRTSPLAIIIQIFGAIITATLPLATTYFASLTTTELALAYNTGESDRLLLYVITTIMLGVALSLWRIVQRYSDQLLRYKVEAVVADQMTERLHRLEFWRYDDVATVDMFDRAKRFSYSFPYIFSQIFQAMSSIISLIVGLWLISTISWWLGVLLIIAIIPGGVVQLKLSRLNTNHWRKNVDVRRKKSWIEYVLESPRNVTELRLYGIIDFLLKLRSKLRDKDKLQMIKYERKYMGWRFVGDIIQSMAEVVALVWVTLEIVAHRQPIGQFVLAQQMVGRVVGSADMLINIYDSMDEDLTNMVDYRRFIELPMETLKPEQGISLQQSIDVRHVKFHYHGSDKLVLKDVSLQIKLGQHVALVGENGAGKTTLLKLLTGLYQPVAGEILIDGRSLSEIHMVDWHKQLAVLGQEFIRYDFATANENVWYGDTSKPVDKSKLDQALSNAEATDFVAKLPKGGDTYVDKWMNSEGTDGKQKGVDISGGQWQRLALARNFYRDAPIVILDEPTSAIDAAAEARIFRHLFQQKNKTIISISHRLSTIKKADIIYFMQDGCIVECGDYQSLVEKRGEFYKMFKEQL